MDTASTETRELFREHGSAVYRFALTMDHDTPGRFRFASFGPDGQPISSIAEDPVQRRRVTLMVVEGQAYRFETTLPHESQISLPELERLHMVATITMMQASGNQLLQVVDTPGGQEYRIEVRHDGNAATNPVWDLTSARVVVRADDYRINEFSAAGTFLKKPYSVSYKLIRQTVVESLELTAFDVPAQPGQLELSGEGSAVPARDAMILAFRELSRLKQAR